VPRESLDAPEDPPKQVPCQGALGELEHEIPGMSNQAPACLEQPLLQARQRPILDGEGQGKPAQEIAKIVRDDAQEQPHLIRAEPMAGEAGPMGRAFALLDPMLRGPAL
jgi:hypothetical protein